MRINGYFLSCLISLCLLASCKTDSNQKSAASETKMKKEKYTLTPFTSSPQYSDAKITNMSYNKGKFNFSIAGDSYELGTQTSDAPQKMCANSAKGQHIHLIIDNAPYAAKYVSEFEHEVTDGEHYLLAFLSRSYHESIKSDGASVSQLINVKDGSIESAKEIESPMLYYSRPKGSYTGKDTKKVMLDFYLDNTTISPTGNYVEADINGETHKITKWQPYYIEGLTNGDNTIKLSLKDASGKLLDIPLNPVSRTFKVMADPVAAQ